MTSQCVCRPSVPQLSRRESSVGPCQCLRGQAHKHSGRQKHGGLYFGPIFHRKGRPIKLKRTPKPARASGVQHRGNHDLQKNKNKKKRFSDDGFSNGCRDRFSDRGPPCGISAAVFLSFAEVPYQGVSACYRRREAGAGGGISAAKKTTGGLLIVCLFKLKLCDNDTVSH